MRPYIRPKPPTSGYHITYIEIDDNEIDDVKVWWESSPPEPDVGHEGDFEVTGIEKDGVDLMPKVTADELESLSQRIYEYLNSYYEDY